MIKNILRISTLVLLISTSVKAQVSLTTDSLSMRKGNQPAFILEIDGVNYKKTKTKWIKTITERNKAKAIINNLDIEVLDAQVTDLIKDSLNIYSRVLNKENRVVIESFYELPRGYVNKSNKDDIEGTLISQYLLNFGKESFNLYIENILSELNGDLTGLEKELSKSEARVPKLNKDIKDNLEQNTDYRDNNLSLDSELKATVGSIDKQNKLISTLTPGSDVMKEANKGLKSLQKTKKKKEKKKDKNLKKIENNLKVNVKKKIEIERTESSIVNLTQQIKEKKEKIENTFKRKL